MKNKLKDHFLNLVQNKKTFQIISFVISLGIIFYFYEYQIKNTITDIKLIKQNINRVKKNELNEKISKLTKQKNEKIKEYKELNEIAKRNKEAFYTDEYDVVVDVINKLNTTSFNIYNYDLNDKYDEMTLELNGSYLNLIKFFDFLQTIKANVNIEQYSVFLKDDKMILKLKIKIGLLKI